MQLRVKSSPLWEQGALTVPRRKPVVIITIIFSSVQSLSRVRLFATLWIAARQACLSITNSWSSLRLTSIESVMPSSHLIFCRPLLLLPPIPPSIRVFSKESTLRMRWPKYWSFSLSIIQHLLAGPNFFWVIKCAMPVLSALLHDPSSERLRNLSKVTQTGCVRVWTKPQSSWLQNSYHSSLHCH